MAKICSSIGRVSCLFDIQMNNYSWTILNPKHLLSHFSLLFFNLIFAFFFTELKNSRPWWDQPTHRRQWAWQSWSWRSACPCWKPHRWVPPRPPPERPCGSCWTWLSSHHCLPADREHTWQFRRGTGSLGACHCHSRQGEGKKRGKGGRGDQGEKTSRAGRSRGIQMAN